MGLLEAGQWLALVWLLLSIPVSLVAGRLLARTHVHYPLVRAPRPGEQVATVHQLRPRRRATAGRVAAVSATCAAVVFSAVGTAAALGGLPSPAQSATATVIEALSPFTVPHESPTPQAVAQREAAQREAQRREAARTPPAGRASTRPGTAPQAGGVPAPAPGIAAPTVAPGSGVPAPAPVPVVPTSPAGSPDPSVEPTDPAPTGPPSTPATDPTTVPPSEPPTPTEEPSPTGTEQPPTPDPTPTDAPSPADGSVSPSPTPTDAETPGPAPTP